MILTKETVWVIMTTDRKYIGKGTPRNRVMIPVDDTTDRKRYLTYSSKGRAEAAFKNHGFYTVGRGMSEEYVAVKVNLLMEELT